MAHKTLVNGTSYEITGGKTLVNGTSYSISKGRTLVNGTGYDVSFKTPISGFPVGTSVYLYEGGGTAVEYIIVQQGNPDTSTYDSSCNGTWIMRKEVLVGECPFYDETWDINQYAGYELDYTLNTTLYNKFSAQLKTAIQTAKIPYINGTNKGTYQKLENGLPRNVFAPSNYELGFVESDNSGVIFRCGSKLSYFKTGDNTTANNLRKAYRGTKVVEWWLRTPCKHKQYYADTVSTSGWYSFAGPSSTLGARPMLILKPDTNVPKDMIITGA